ncbi:MAG: hypothetical protein IKQ77_13235, partial [Prevotella sp.]|nr:hypothetical protein [Prevotella sp.]
IVVQVECKVKLACSAEMQPTIERSSIVVQFECKVKLACSAEMQPTIERSSDTHFFRNFLEK